MNQDIPTIDRWNLSLERTTGTHCPPYEGRDQFCKEYPSGRLSAYYFTKERYGLLDGPEKDPLILQVLPQGTFSMSFKSVYRNYSFIKGICLHGRFEYFEPLGGFERFLRFFVHNGQIPVQDPIPMDDKLSIFSHHDILIELQRYLPMVKMFTLRAVCRQLNQCIPIIFQQATSDILGHITIPWKDTILDSHFSEINDSVPTVQFKDDTRFQDEMDL